jgi:hypothetical protein
VTVRPAIVSDPVRCAVVGFAAALNVTVPLPAPLPPFAIAIHDVDDVADQPQPTGAVTEKVLDPAVDPIDRAEGLTE